MIKVWSVEGHTPYEGSETLGIFSTEAKAENFAATCRAARRRSGDPDYENYYVCEYVVDAVS